MNFTHSTPSPVNVLHTWFTSGSYSLLGHLHAPENGKFDFAVLIVPPFGWEDACCYRPLRELGNQLAAEGIPAFRFDLPATGDSSGMPQDEGLLAAWIHSIGDAACEVRRLTGAADVAVVGIRLGAMLALAAAQQLADIQDLVLWAPYATGRSMLRELRAFRNLEVPEFASQNGAGQPEAAPSEFQDSAGLEVAGYLLSAETQQSLETLDLAAAMDIAVLKAPRHRVLMLTRDKMPPDAKLNRALLGAGWPLDSEVGLGFSGMTSPPHEAIAPLDTFQKIIQWLVGGRQADGMNTPLRGALRAQTETESLGSESVESIAHASPSKVSYANFAILSTLRPASQIVVGQSIVGQSVVEQLAGVQSIENPERDPPDLCLLFLNAGAMRHVGPNRMWVDAARRWAARGVPSLRLDLRGIGESDGEQKLDVAALYQESLTEQVEQATVHLGERIGARRFLAVGLCSGAFLAFHAAAQNPAIRGALLLNPRLFFWDPEVDQRRDLRTSSAALRNSDAWWRFLQGQVEIKRLKNAARNVWQSRPANPRPQIPAERLRQALSQTAKHGTRLTMVFTEGEPLLREMEEEGYLPGPFQCIRVANAGHTLRPFWAQREVHKILDREIDALIEAAPGEPHSANRLALERS